MREGRLVGSVFPELTFTLQDICVIEQQREGRIRVIWTFTKSLSSTALIPLIFPLGSSKVRDCACWRFRLFGMMGDIFTFLHCCLRSREARLARGGFSLESAEIEAILEFCVDDGRLGAHDRKACEFVDFVV
jgi:hypothetical protein